MRRKIVIYCLILLCTYNNYFSQQSHSEIFKFINLDYPGLDKVKSFLIDGDTLNAELELLNYYKNRINIINNLSEIHFPANIAEAKDNAKNIFDMKTIRKDFKNEIQWEQVQTDREWQFSLGRMNWFLNYIGVYKKTSQEEYVEAWMNQIRSWISLGKPGSPRTIDTGRRMENWVYSYLVFVEQYKSNTVTPEFNSLFLTSLYQQAEFIYNPQNWRRYSNWGTFENSGLSKLAVLFPEFKDSQKWLKEIFFRMRVQLENSYHKDGMHVEVSPLYQSHELEVWLDFLELVKLNKVENPWRSQIPLVPIDSLLQRNATALMSIYKPTGLFPNLGDTDERDNRIFLKRLYKYLGDSSLLYVASDGKEGKVPQRTSYAFPEGGYYIMRSGWGNKKLQYKNEFQLIFDSGSNRPWHAHYDALNIVATAYGYDLLTDGGRYTYNDGIERDNFKSTAYHNTIVVDSKSQKQNNVHKKANWNFFNEYDYIVGESDAYDDVKHSRSIFFVKGEYWLVVDRLKSKLDHNYAQYWNLSDKSLGNITINQNIVLAPHLLMFSPEEGNIIVDTSYISYEYLIKKERPVIRVNYKNKQNVVLPQLIVPYNQEIPKMDVEFRALNGIIDNYDSDTNSIFVTVKRENQVDIIFEKHSSNKLISINGIVTDARLVFLRLEDAAITKILMVNGSLLKYNDLELIDFYSKKVNVEICNTSIHISGSDLCNFSIYSSTPKKMLLNEKSVENVLFENDYYRQ